MSDGFNVAMPCSNCGNHVRYWVAGDIVPAARALDQGSLTVYCDPCARILAPANRERAEEDGS